MTTSQAITDDVFAGVQSVVIRSYPIVLSVVRTAETPRTTDFTCKLYNAEFSSRPLPTGLRFQLPACGSIRAISGITVQQTSNSYFVALTNNAPVPARANGTANTVPMPAVYTFTISTRPAGLGDLSWYFDISSRFSAKLELIPPNSIPVGIRIVFGEVAVALDESKIITQARILNANLIRGGTEAHIVIKPDATCGTFTIAFLQGFGKSATDGLSNEIPTTTIPYDGVPARRVLTRAKENFRPNGLPFRMSNWVDCGEECSYTGVTCQGQKVIKLDLSNMGLNGSLPDDLWELTDLISLNISYNNFSSGIPGQLLKNLTSLKDLDLSGNPFTGTLPCELSSLALTRLHLGNLQRLEKADLPACIGSVTTLVELDMSGTGYTGNIPSTWNNLTNLQELDLSSNDLTGTIPSTTVESWSSLQVLDVSDNSGLCGTLSTDAVTIISGTDMGAGSCISRITDPAPEVAGMTSTVNTDPSLGMPLGPEGKVGKLHFIQAVNVLKPGSNTTWSVMFTVYSKSLGSVLQNATRMSAYANSTLCDATGARGEPQVLYDQVADRWVLMELGKNANGSEHCMCLLVSKTGDPLAGWYPYKVTTPWGAARYPRLGLWARAVQNGTYSFNSYVVTTNEGQPVLYVMDRDRMIQGLAPRTEQIFSPTVMSAWGRDFSLLSPATLGGDTTPANSCPYFVRQMDDEVHERTASKRNATGDLLEIWRACVDFVNARNSIFFKVIPAIAVTEFDSLLCGITPGIACVPQRNSTQKMDPMKEFIPFQAMYRQFATYESIVGSFTVNVADSSSAANGTLAGVFWFELRSQGSTNNWYLYQQGTQKSADEHRFAASIILDGIGNIAMGYTVSGLNTYPELRYAGHIVTELPGTLQDGESVFTTGKRSSRSSKWDVAVLSIDPVKKCDIYITGINTGTEPSSGEERTMIAKFSFASCVEAIPQV